MKLTVDGRRVAEELDTLAGITAAEPPVVTRVLFTNADLRGRAYTQGLLEDVGLEIRCDAVGNMFARWPGTEPSLPAIATGSHIDAIPNAGRFDGTVGVLGAIEAIRALKAAAFQPRRSLELIVFTSEEPTRFGIGCLGSRLIAGTTSADADERLLDKEGISLKDARTQAGFSGSLEGVRLEKGHYHAFVELHIEQGPILEREGLGIGIVKAIAAPSSFRISIEGEGGHAGAVLMPVRRDAFLAASEIALAVEAAVLASGSEDSVGTTGVCEVFPGAINSIPSRVKLEIDIRDIDQARRDGIIARMENSMAEISARRKVKISSEVLNADPTAVCDPSIVTTIRDACDAHNIHYKEMISRAYHDSLFMAQIAPTAMVFIPCKAGVSHRPDEYSSPEEIALGVKILAETLARLSA